MVQRDPMNCPRCGKEARLEAEKGPLGIEVDRCPTCKGLWLDRGEVFAYDPEARETLNRMLADASEWKTPTERECPRCRKRMDKSPVGTQRLLLEMCGSCEGIWLDEGEIEALVGMLKEGA